MEFWNSACKFIYRGANGQGGEEKFLAIFAIDHTFLLPEIIVKMKWRKWVWWCYKN